MTHLRIMLLVLLLSWMGVMMGVTHAQESDEGDEMSLNVTQFYTYHQATGNRLVEGSGTFPNVRAIELTPGGVPVWLVGAVLPSPSPQNALTWVMTLADGSIQGTFVDQNGEFHLSPVLPDGLPADMPPVFTLNEIGAFPEVEFPADASERTHPVTVGERTLYIATDGAVVLTDEDGDEITRLPFNALPDARIVINTERTQAAIYVGATDERYVHAIMGDTLEGAALMVVNLEDGSVPTIIDLTGDEVFEGLSPIWADVDEDGTEDLITTVSASGAGAQIRVYRATDGSLLASGPAIGQSNRWRHQLAWGAFGPNGEMQLAEVLTPHIGGIVGFYRYDGANSLDIVATLEGFTSHVINSPNLDMAVGGDFDGDGQPEIVMPNQQRDRIAGLVHRADGSIEETWSLPLDGILITNLAAISTPDGRLALAAGVTIGREARLRVWVP